MLGALEASGELDRTLVVFSADHGELLGDFGCFGKRSFHEASQRVPLLASLPGRFRRNAVCASPASLVDLLPTFLSAAGLPVPPDCDGTDLADIAQGTRRRTPVLFHYARGKDAILGAVVGRWKYAWSAPDQREFLFDRREMPERRNRAGEAAAEPALARLRRVVQTRAAAHTSSRDALDRTGGWRTFRPVRMPTDPDAELIYQDPPSASPELPPEFHLEYPRKNEGKFFRLLARQHQAVVPPPDGQPSRAAQSGSSPKA